MLFIYLFIYQIPASGRAGTVTHRAGAEAGVASLRKNPAMKAEETAWASRQALQKAFATPN